MAPTQTTPDTFGPSIQRIQQNRSWSVSGNSLVQAFFPMELNTLTTTSPVDTSTALTTVTLEPMDTSTGRITTQATG